MSQPTGGSLGQNWGGQGDGQNSGNGDSLGQGWNQGSDSSSGSLGQDWGQGSSSGSSESPTQQWGQGSSSGSSSATGQSSGQQWSNDSYGQQGTGQNYGQFDYGQQSNDNSYGNPSAPAQHSGHPAGTSPASGIGALFSDLKFKQSLTENLAQLAFLGVLVYSVLKFLANTIHNFGSTDYGGADVKNMGTFDAVMHLLADLVWLVVVVAIARILLELAVNVARIAQRKRD